MALTADEIRESCMRCGLTTLLCEQDYDDTMEDVREMNPDMTEYELAEATLIQMLDENLDFGPLDDDELEARADISEEVAEHWLAGEFSGDPRHSEIEQANAMSRRLAKKVAGK